MLQQIVKTQKNSSISDFNAEDLYRAQRRLATFQLLGGAYRFKQFMQRINSVSSSNEDMNDADLAGTEWQTFRKTSMLEMIQGLMRIGNIEDAALLWRRHCFGK